MAANTGFLSTNELDFRALKQNLKTFLQNQSTLQDYNFEGSNLSVLIDLLTYNTYINAHYLNMIGSEMFLDTALLRESVVSHSKELNYVPRSRSSARVSGIITVGVPIGPTMPATVTIPKGYQIRSVVDSRVLRFVTDQAHIIKRNSNNQYISGTITFYEGILVSEVFEAKTQQNSDGTYNPYIYPLTSENIDTSSIEVYVQESKTDATKTSFKYADSLFGINRLSNVFFIEGYGSNKYQLVFGNDVIGKALKNGNMVFVTYRDTVGLDGNDAYKFTTGGPIEIYPSVYVTIADAPSRGGAERESLENIKYIAPRHFQTQERAVVETDFETLVKTKFPNIQAVTAYGGEFAEPKQYGKAIISVKPFGINGVITNRQKEQIIEHLKLKSITTEPVVKDPEFFYADIKSTVQYDEALTIFSENNIKQQIITALLDLNLTWFNDFGKDLRYSRICSVIDDVLDTGAIVSNDTIIRMIYRWTPVLNAYTSVNYSYDNELSNEGTRYLLPSGHEAIIESTEFIYTKNNIDYTAHIRDDGLGVLNVYTISPSGDYLVLESNIGTVNYTTGKIDFKLAVKSYVNYISIYARTENKDFIIQKSKFIILDGNDFDITVTRARY